MTDDARPSRPAPARPVHPGHLVAGRYRLLSRIGSGAMGAVWLATDQLLGREVAVKQVLTTAGMDPAQAQDQRSRALREGRIAARLNHPHAIALYDVAVDAGEPWLVMEHLPSRSLAAVVTDRGRLPAGEVAQIGAQVADALAAAHAAGIVHRDVKPGNVLIAESGRDRGTVKIADFGISRARGDVTVTRTGIITGTPAYFAPEVARGEDPTEASDVFSLGATLYTAVEGLPPFGLDANAVALLHRVAAGVPTPPQRAGAMTPVLLRMLEPDPARRPTMTEVRDGLGAIAGGGRAGLGTVLAARTTVLATPAPAGPAPADPPPAPPTLVGAPVPWSGTPAPDDRRRRTTTLVAAAAVLVLLAGLAVFLSVRGSSDTGARSPLPTTAPSAAPARTTTPATTAPTTTAPTTTAPTTVEPADLTQDQLATAVRDYVALLPSDTATAWSRLTPGYQAQGSFAAFDTYWRGFSTVQLREAAVADDGTAQVELRLTPRGGKAYTVVEQLDFAADPAGGSPLISGSTTIDGGPSTRGPVERGPGGPPDGPNG